VDNPLDNLHVASN